MASPLKQPRNPFELLVFKRLRRLKAKFKYESERISYLIAGHYVPDFVVDTKDGKIYIETKGYLRAADKRKLVAVKKLHPTLDLRILFYSRKEKDIKWAEKNRIPWAIYELPKEWTR